MTNQRNTKAVLFLDGNRVMWSQQGLQNILAVEFPPSAFQHFEVLQKEEIYKTIKTTIEQEKIPPANIILLLSSRLVFSQQFAKDTDVKKNQEQEEKFLGVVPFEDVSSVTMEAGKNMVIIAANQEYYEVVSDALLANGFTVDLVVPTIALGEGFANATALDGKMAQTAIGRSEALKKYSFSPVKKFEEVVDLIPEEKQHVKPKPTRMYIMIGMLVILFGILGFLVYNNILKQPVPRKVEPTHPAAVEPSPSPVDTSNATESAMTALNKENLSSLSAQIQPSNGVVEGTDLKRQFEAIGLTNVTVAPTSKINIPETKIIFSDKVPVEFQNILVHTLEQTYTGVTTTQQNASQYDIIIITGPKK